MKPRIVKHNGLWTCRAIGTLTGIGYTIRAAYADWYKSRYGAVAE